MLKVNKAKNISAGVGAKGKKAPMVDPKGAYTKVQQRTLGNMKKGGKVVSKKK
jgi:multidrug resistance efflux pump